MHALPQTTKRRLQKIPQIPSVWEGDRRALAGMNSDFEPDADAEGQCIIWVDGSEGFVRAMDVVSPEMGIEAVVRTLLRAMESPHSPAQPARPQKIIVRDRQLQFFLRGALQNLDINVDYAPDLPVIDEIFRSFSQLNGSNTPSIPAPWKRLLEEIAYELWADCPWDILADRDILAIELNRWDVETIYACVMGMLGKEYGVILYRSLESLKRFREVVLSDNNLEDLEKAFLDQDCWFLNFEPVEELEEEDDEDEIDIIELSPEEIYPLYGSIHVFEGMRPLRDEEEAMAIYTALKALQNFYRDRSEALMEDEIEAIEETYNISLPNSSDIAIKISTLPQLTQELSSLVADEDDEDEDFTLKEDLIPPESFISLRTMPTELIQDLQQNSKSSTQSYDLSSSKTNIPVLLIQTSRPKAKEMIDKIENAGGLKGICFNPGENPLTGELYDLGIIQTGNEDLYLFAEYVKNNSQQTKARKQWYQHCQKNNGLCFLVVAMGVTGASRGQPQRKDLMALFATKAMDAKELDVGILQLMPQFDWDL